MNIILWRQRNRQKTARVLYELRNFWGTLFLVFICCRVFLEILFDPFVIDERYGMNWLMYGKTQPRVRSDES